MKKSFILMFLIVTVIDISGISTDGPKENVADASNEIMNVGELNNNSRESTEKFRAEFAYEMAKITEKIISDPATNVESFQIQFSYATAQVTAKIMSIIPSGQRTDFAYKMAQITTKIISDKNLNIEKAKAEFAYEIAQLTTKIITNADTSVTDNRTMLKVNNTDTASQTPRLKNNADIEPKSTGTANNAEAWKKAPDNVNNTNSNPQDVDKETYNGLINELAHEGDSDNTVKIDGEARYHYAWNSGSPQWDKNSSGIRVRLGFGTNIDDNWRANAMLELDKKLVNYDNKLELSRLNVVGNVGAAKVTAGSFGYLMAEGNIYDSGFKGVRLDFGEGESMKYTFGYGETDYSKKTAIATARYNDFDYNLEAGVYHYQMDNGGYNQNTIRTLSGNYNFSNFGVGAMYLNSNLKDSKGERNGYVFSFNYGDFKTYRPGTYDIFVKYYNQPLGTYIVHGMNGIGNLGLMQGFKGYGVGTHYTFSENLVGGLEYYNLKDKISGERGQTWWSELTRYF